MSRLLILISFEVRSHLFSDAKGESYQVSSVVRRKCLDFGARRVGKSISDKSAAIRITRGSGAAVQSAAPR
jgi:hypothetical protein